MKKMTLSVLCATLFLSSLTACGTQQDDKTGMKEQRIRTQRTHMNERIGDGDRIYPYDDRAQNEWNDSRFPDDQRTIRGDRYQQTRDGKVRDQTNMDHSRERAYRYKNRTMRAAVIPEERGITGNNRVGMVDEDGFINRMGRRDNRGMNTQEYNDRTRRYDRSMQRMSETPLQYHRDYYGKEVRQLTDAVEKIKGVKEARVLIHGNDVVVGYVADQPGDKLHARVKSEVERLIDEGKDVTVTSDDYAFSTMRTMDDQLRTGKNFREMENTFTDMLDDIRNMLRRPVNR